MDPRELSDFVARVHNLDGRDEIDGATIGILDAFNAAGLRAVLLKGPALERFLYGEGEHRSYSDVDLLVEPGGLQQARDILSHLGYVDASAHTLWGVDDVAGLQHAEVWTHGGRGRDRPLMVDLHWRIHGWDAPPQAIWAALGTRLTSIPLRGREVPVLNRDALAVHIASHAAQHGPDDPKAIGDLARAIERWPEPLWRSATALAEQVGATAAFAAGIRLLPEGAVLAQRLALPRTDRLDWEIVNRPGRPRGTFHLQALADAGTARERIHIVRGSLLPSRVWMGRRYRWAQGTRVRLVLAYALHVLGAPVWLARALRYRRRSRDAGA